MSVPSKSKSQQRLFGMVRDCQKTGKCASPDIRKLADNIGDKDAEDFAKTKHKGLPNRIKKKMFESFKEWLDAQTDESFNPKKRLKGSRRKLDLAPPFGKIDSEDFKKLRGEKK